LSIDWGAPWFLPWRASGEPVAAQVFAGASCAQALNGQLERMRLAGMMALPLRRFVPQSELPAGCAYEHFIFETGQIPTRDGLHDFFNGLCWLRFPKTKMRLNALQAAQIERDGIGPVRGPVRDALTIVDENAALLQAPDALWEALVAGDWRALFIELRPLWSQAQLVVFGHALLEKLTMPRKGITAHVLRVRADSGALEDVDLWLSESLSAEQLAAKPFAPLPVLGVPGWWGANDNPMFYADASVFRVPRRALR
jgi:hypothetical protein